MNDAPKAAPREQRTVLVVDDEPVVRDVTCSMLRSAGYGVQAAAGGGEAIAILESGDASIDLVLLDLTMPGMDGWQTLEALRQIRPELLVVFSTGHVDDDVQQRIESSGVAAFIHKPFKLDVLLQVVAKGLAHASATWKEKA